MGSRRGDRRRRGGVRRFAGSIGTGVAVGKAPASQGICWVKHIEAELLDLVEPAREEAVAYAFLL